MAKLKKPPVPVWLMQTDSRWRYDKYSLYASGVAPDGSVQTIGSSGCGPTSCAMIVQTRCASSVTPPDVCKWMLAHGYRTSNNGTDYAGIKAYLEHYGFDVVQTASDADAIAWLKKGQQCVQVWHGPSVYTSGGHFGCAYEVDKDGNVHDRDPYSTAKIRNIGPIKQFTDAAAYYWLIKFQKKRKATEDLKVYQKTSTKSPVVGTIKKGKCFYIFGQSLNGNWGRAKGGFVLLKHTKAAK